MGKWFRLVILSSLSSNPNVFDSSLTVTYIKFSK
jgi:hypothetical protein